MQKCPCLRIWQPVVHPCVVDLSYVEAFKSRNGIRTSARTHRQVLRICTVCVSLSCWQWPKANLLMEHSNEHAHNIFSHEIKSSSSRPLWHPTHSNRSNVKFQWVDGSVNRRLHCDVTSFGQTKHESTASSATSPAAKGTYGDASQQVYNR